MINQILNVIVNKKIHSNLNKKLKNKKFKASRYLIIRDKFTSHLDRIIIQYF